MFMNELIIMIEINAKFLINENEKAFKSICYKALREVDYSEN